MDAGESDRFRLTHTVHGRSETVEFSCPRAVIGRSRECDLVISVPGVSRRHAAIARDAKGWTISDLTSRYGTFVNGQRVVSRRLRDGDRITLGMADESGSTLVFGLLPEAREESIVFDDDADAANIHLTINVTDVERSMGGARRDVLGEEPGAGASDETKAPVREEPAAPGAGRGQAGGAGVSIIGLFKQIGEALLTSDDLEEMLERVVELALAHLPAQRGFICLCDEAGETITPKAMHAKGLARGEPIYLSRTIAREAIRARQALLVSDVLSDARFAQAKSVLAVGIRSAMCSPLYHAGRVEGLVYVDSFGAGHQFVAPDLELLAALGVLAAVGIAQARLREEVNRERAIRARLSRYSSPHVVEQIVASATSRDGEMLAEQREVTVLFADLSRFTSMVEGVDPSAVAQVLNSAFERLTRAVFLYDGTLDKYLGDGLLAIFGAPLPQSDHAERAIRAAMLMQQMLGESAVTGPRGEPLEMRIGINSGTAVAGDIGSPIRKDYTVVGDAINVASRLESSVAKPGQIIIGPATHELCRSTFDCLALPEVRLKGKQQSIRPYLVIGSRGLRDSGTGSG